MLDILILTIGKLKINYFKDASEEYLKRLKPYARITTRELKAESFNASNKLKVKKEEGRRISEFLKKQTNCLVIFLEEKGKQYNSLQLAELLEKENRKIIFVIAGSLGFDKEIEYQPDLTLSLSALTFNHELARVVLLEQLYRGATIINGKEYHY